MPELPEAETIARALNRAPKRREIVRVETFTTCHAPVAKIVLGGWYCPHCQH